MNYLQVNFGPVMNGQTATPTTSYCAPSRFQLIMKKQNRLVHHLISTNLHCAPPKCNSIQNYTVNLDLQTATLTTSYCAPSRLWFITNKQNRLVHCLISTNLHRAPSKLHTQILLIILNSCVAVQTFWSFEKRAILNNNFWILLNLVSHI